MSLFQAAGTQLCITTRIQILLHRCWMIKRCYYFLSKILKKKKSLQTSFKTLLLHNRRSQAASHKKGIEQQIRKKAKRQEFQQWPNKIILITQQSTSNQMKKLRKLQGRRLGSDNWPLGNTFGPEKVLWNCQREELSIARLHNHHQCLASPFWADW